MGRRSLKLVTQKFLRLANGYETGHHDQGWPWRKRSFIKTLHKIERRCVRVRLARLGWLLVSCTKLAYVQSCVCNALNPHTQSSKLWSTAHAPYTHSTDVIHNDVMAVNIWVGMMTMDMIELSLLHVCNMKNRPSSVVTCVCNRPAITHLFHLSQCCAHSMSSQVLQHHTDNRGSMM